MEETDSTEESTQTNRGFHGLQMDDQQISFTSKHREKLKTRTVYLCVPLMLFTSYFESHFGSSPSPAFSPFSNQLRLNHATFDPPLSKWR